MSQKNTLITMAWRGLLETFFFFVLFETVTTIKGQASTRTNYRFLGLSGTTVLTSSGNLTSQGHVVLLTSGSHGVLDLQGPSFVTFPSERCLENLDSCTTGFTVSLTFRAFLTPNNSTSRVYVLDSGSESNSSNFTGIVLYSEDGDRLTCMLSGTAKVWELETVHRMSPTVWQQLHVSWHPVLGLTLWSGVNVLATSVKGQPKTIGISLQSQRMSESEPSMNRIEDEGHGQVRSAGGQVSNEGQHQMRSSGVRIQGEGRVGVLRFGSKNNPESSHVQISGLSVVEAFVTDIFTGGLGGFYTTRISTKSTQTPPLPATNVSSTSTTAPTKLSPTSTSAQPPSQKTTTAPNDQAAPTRSPETNVHMTVVNFMLVSGGQTLTTQGTMATHGDVTLEPVPIGLVLVLDQKGESVDLGYPLPCLRDVTSCRDGFNLRITFELLKIVAGHNMLLSSGGDQLDLTGVTLSYFNDELVFVVKTNVTTWIGLHAITLMPGIWYTVDGSWDGHKNGTLYVNNQEVHCRAYNVPHPPSTRGTHSLLLATGPGHPGSSTLMKVYELMFSATERASLNDQNLDLPILGNESLDTITVDLESTAAATSRGDDTQVPVSNERLEGTKDASGGDKVTVIALGTLCSLLAVGAVIGGVLCLAARRNNAKKLRVLKEQYQAPLSVGYAFRARPRAYHSRSFSSITGEMMY